MTLSLLCAGAARGLVAALEPAFTAANGVAIDGTFGAVGALHEELLAGAPCDVVVLTSALIATLERDGHVVPDSASSLGLVRTGIAVRAAESAPDIHDAASLRGALRNATRLYFPDPERATAGIHFVAVLRRLGIHGHVAGRCVTFPNGATAMRALADSRQRGELGCTQVTEINYTPGVALAGALPAGFDLATAYVAPGCTRGPDDPNPRRFVQRLTAPESPGLR